MRIDPFEILQELGLKSPGGIIQVGASYGQELDEFQSKGIRAGVFIEPLPEPFRHLSGRCQRIPDFVAVNTLCADRTGEVVKFNVASNGGMSSSMLVPQNHLTEFTSVRFDQTIDVMANRLDHVVDFLRQHGHGGVCDVSNLLYMDTQGAELKVLQGAGGVLDGVDYIVTEVTRNALYAGAPTVSELLAFLEPRGFSLNNINFDGHHHSDALFIRNRVLNIH